MRSRMDPDDWANRPGEWDVIRENPQGYGAKLPYALTVPEHLSDSEMVFFRALAFIGAKLAELRRIADDRSRPVNEYQTQTAATQSTTKVTLTPEFQQINARIEHIVVTGPVSPATFTLQLGDRFWGPLTMTTTGVFEINPRGLQLSPQDPRILVGSAAGNWTLELTGWADERY